MRFGEDAVEPHAEFDETRLNGPAGVADGRGQGMVTALDVGQNTTACFEHRAEFLALVELHECQCPNPRRL